MSRMKFATIEVRGQKVDLQVDTSGEFYAEYQEMEFTAPTKDVLVKKLQAVTKKRIAIPFHRWDGGKLKKGVITGVHAANGNVLMKFDGGACEQDRSWVRGDFLRLTPAECQEYEKMQKEYLALGERIEKFEEGHKFNAREAAEEAIGKASP